MAKDLELPDGAYTQPGRTWYLKGVRDEQAEIIKREGNTPKTLVLDPVSWDAVLREKLQEEVAEFLAEDDPDKAIFELADVLAVVMALSEPYGGPDALYRADQLKGERKGWFTKRLFLLFTDRVAKDE